MPVDDIIDRALDSAEEIISDANPDPVEAPKEESKPEPITEPGEEDVPQAAKDSKQISGKEANEEEDKADSNGEAEGESPATPEDEPIEIPAFLPADTKALLAEASPQLRKKVIAAYAQQEETTRRALGEAGSLKAEKARVDEVLSPHRTRLQAQGIRDTSDLVSRALAWDELMTKDIKGFLVAQLKQNGLTPNDLYEGAEEVSGAQITDPRIDEAIEEAKSAKQAFEDFQLNQQKQVLASKLESFKNGKDSTGATRKTFVEMFEPQIAHTIGLIKADPQYQHLSEDEILHHSYEYVVSNARSGFQAVTPQKQAPTQEQIIANAKKQKAASGSVRGAPASGTSNSRPRLKGDSFNERLDSALDLAESRSSSGR